MKKSLIALAVLAASGAAMAQSAVTIYGIADVWFGSEKNGDVRDTKIGSGGVSGSRWGIKGSEDLGGGLKANFNFEQGVDLDTGKAGTTNAGTAAAFSRQSWVGLSGGFGAVRLGRTTTAYDDVSGASDAVFDSALSPFGYTAKSTGYIGRPDNTIYYQAPSFSGFSGAVSYSLGEDKNVNPVGSSATSLTSMALTYDAGPLSVQFGYQVENGKTANDQKFTRLGAIYDFGVAKAYATYGKVDNLDNVASDEAKDWQLGLDFPVSSALTLSASYARTTYNEAAVDFTSKGYGIGAAYSLSKRTTVYGGYESDKTTASNVADAKHNLLAVGIKHTF